ncbi:M23 family metallopeptidase [Agrobacterium rubi]|uniref:M23 family metallopeptidase n=1 Tax=Agrobacterium rubi TaxID=28099 RepID=UPI001573DEBD|nr:M23 family metallopeptidase [Agrobacterium rubi]NTF09345.1 M23 family metallopeptidase [Agrobacterium rubi]NTF22767.1 M23 family metallopeptidase [Agrobacterium rubi]NTF29629.1 M23 family metallopeptidase [Agrobacterium rubi]
MMTDRDMVRSLGNEPPILAEGRRAPDRREISLRWLSGTFLTGITSSILMGVALFAALDGRQQLAIPAEAFARADMEQDASETVRRGTRLLGQNIAARPSDRSVMEVSTVIHDGDKEVVRKVPFSHVKIALAANYNNQEDYPPFDPLNIFATNDDASPAASKTGTIYGSEVESEVSLKTVAFPTKNSPFAFAGSMSFDEVEEAVRSNGSMLTDGNEQLSALYYIDPRRFEATEDVDMTAGLAARVVEQNMSVSTPQASTVKFQEYADDVIPVRQAETMEEALFGAGYSKEQAKQTAAVLSAENGSADVQAGDVLRIGILQSEEKSDIVRASLYRKGRHMVTVATDDTKQFVRASEPPHLDAVATAFDSSNAPLTANRDLPRVYDGVYRAALTYGMNQTMVAQLVKLLASSVDFQAQLKPTDSLEAFFSVQGPDGKATDQSELLYVNAKFGDNETRFYRFQNPDDGSVDYFDGQGKSIRQFLIRNPVPNGRMTSGFGMRRHPVLRFSRMHTGTDWAAPRGTPIIATGNGIVEKSGWASGYGNQTLIRHANGYVSSYNHQNAIAKGVTEGARVTQGQVIGYVGSTGLSTGAHLHYELIVNGTKVDAMKVRLPGGKSLSGEALARFSDERRRIDTLLNIETKPEQVASR